jgi:hypothetical protein
VTLSPTELALAWYWTEPPEGWVYGHGDICADVPYVVLDAITRQILVEPVLAVCTEHPCDTANDPSARVGFARAFYLDEALEQNSRLWNLLPDVAAGRHLDFWLLPALPTLWDADILVDLRDRFSVSQAEALRATRLAGLHEPYERAFAWRLMLRAGRAQPPHPVAPFARLRQLSSGAPGRDRGFPGPAAWRWRSADLCAPAPARESHPLPTRGRPAGLVEGGMARPHSNRGVWPLTRTGLAGAGPSCTPAGGGASRPF